jgi:hypothetical protein
MSLIFACKKLNVILHIKIRGQMKSVRQNILLTYLHLSESACIESIKVRQDHM